MNLSIERFSLPKIKTLRHNVYELCKYCAKYLPLFWALFYYRKVLFKQQHFQHGEFSQNTISYTFLCTQQTHHIIWLIIIFILRSKYQPQIPRMCIQYITCVLTVDGNLSLTNCQERTEFPVEWRRYSKNPRQDMIINK